MRGFVSLALAGALLGGCTTAMDSPIATGNVEAVRAVMPPQRDQSELQVLFWDQEQRNQRFREMENWFPGLEVAPSPNPHVFGIGEPLDPKLVADIRALMKRSNATGVMVVEDGKIRFEDYGLGLGPNDRWTSFSVAKSFTSTLLGAAIADGFIGSLQDSVTKYIPRLAGSAYDGVTVEQLATMTSGVAWDEDYTDPESDVAQTNRFAEKFGKDAIVEQMRSLKREAPPGTKWVYKTGETNLLGVLVENAVGKPLATYAKDKIVDPAGFAGGLFWMTDPRGGNVGGCCLSLRLSDYARMGQLVLDEGEGVVPGSWFAEATSPRWKFKTDGKENGFGYGYQWWTYPGATFGAQGIFGQAITIVPQKRLVLAMVGSWPTATSNDYRAAWREIAGRIAADGE